VQPYNFDFSLLKKISTRIVNEVEGIARVTYDITSKPPGEFQSLIAFHVNAMKRQL
jgi:GMP synthase (glutamine-hydrolysing)